MSVENLTVDQAAELLSQDPAPVEDAEQEDSQPGTTGDDASEAQEPGDSEDVAQDADPAEGDEEAVAAAPVDAPKWWDADAKARFAELPPEVQEVVRVQEDKREAVTAKVKQEANEARKFADTQAQALSALTQRVQEVLPQAEQAFQDKWADVTPEVWAQMAAEDPQATFILKQQYEAEMGAVRSLRETEAQARVVEQQRFSEQQAARFRELEPELVADQDSMRALGAYIQKSGFTPETIASATAEELQILNKARLWDEAQGKAKALAAKPKLPQDKTPPVRLVAPVAASNGLSNNQREINRLEAKATLSIEETVALMAARRRAGS